MMCQTTKSNDMQLGPAIVKNYNSKYVWMPIIAGILHVVVFTTAVISLLVSRKQSFEYSEFAHFGARVDMAIAVAYSFDLICCFVGVVPFSRCQKTKEIAGHHYPKLIMILFVLPLWTGLNAIDPLVSIGSSHVYKLITEVNGFAAISSLNEVLMCFQRAELGRAGIMSRLGDTTKQGYIGIWTSRPVMLFELLYKLLFFTVFASISFKAALELDMFLYGFYLNEFPQEKTWKLLLRVYFRSPLQIATFMWRLFMLKSYPFLIRRTVRKIGLFSQKAGKTS